MPTPSKTTFPSWRRVLGYAAAGVFAVSLTTALSLADPTPTPKQRLAPDGVDGTLLLCGDKVPEAALDRFVARAGKDKAALVVLSGGGKADREAAEALAAALNTRKPASTGVFSADANDPKALDALRNATGAGLIGAIPEGDTLKALRGVMRRGAVAGSGADLAALLPGTVIQPGFRADDADKLFQALDRVPGTFGLGLGEGAALLVQGREMSAVGDGAVTVLLAKSTVKPRRVLEINEKSPSDLTMLRRAALARAEPPFPAKEPATPETPKGALVIVGGGGMPVDVTKKFIELAGGPDASIVVLPTASPGPPADAENSFFKKAGAKHVVALPAVKLEEVEDPKNLEVLKKADAVWFGGGRQWHFVDAYEGTKAYALFHDVLRRGGVIGGSSAGATIQGAYLCRGSPLNNTDMMCEGYERGFGFLPGVAIDQHFAQRKRFVDMTELIKAYPQVLGVGLDEATAIIVTGHEADVMGKGEAHFYDAKGPAMEGKPDYESLKAGGRYDLKARKVLVAGGL